MRNAAVAFLPAVLLVACGGSPASPTTPVVPSPVLRVSGPMAILVPGASAQLRAIKNYGLYGGEVDVTASATWSTSDASVVVVSAAGLATAITPGSADVTAAIDGLTAAIGIRIAPSPVQLTGQIDADVAADIIAYNQDVSARPTPS